eukprot:UN03569
MSKNWSTNRADAEKVLTELADILKDEPSIKIAQYDFNENYYDHEKFGTEKHESKLLLFTYTGPIGERVRSEKHEMKKWNMGMVINHLAQEFYKAKNLILHKNSRTT